MRDVEVTKMYVRYREGLPDTEMMCYAVLGFQKLGVVIQPFEWVDDVAALDDLGPAVGVAARLHDALRDVRHELDADDIEASEALIELASAEPSPVAAVAEVVHVACFTEDEFADVEHLATEAEARAFASGYTSGAGQYGAGSCAAYVLPAQDHEMRVVEKEREWKKAIAAIEACDAKGGA